MQTIISVQNKGLITIPKIIRQKAGLETGSYIKMSYQAGKIIMEPAQLITYPVRNYADEEIDEFLKEDKLDPILAKKLDKKFGFKSFQE